MFKQYLYNWLVLLSKMVNVFFGGSPHESVSEVVGRRYYIENKRDVGTDMLHSIINWVFTFLGEENHLKDAIDDENKAKSLWQGNK